MAVVAGIFLLPALFKRKDAGANLASDEDYDLSSTAAGCISVPANLAKWPATGDGWFDGYGANHIKTKYGPKFAEYNLVNADHVVEFSHGFFKSLGIKMNLKNIEKFEPQLLAYLKSDFKYPHWEVEVGERAC